MKNSHATTSSVTITRNQYFDVGTAEPTRNLFTKNSNLVKYGGRNDQGLWAETEFQNVIIMDTHRICYLLFYSLKAIVMTGIT